MQQLKGPCTVMKTQCSQKEINIFNLLFIYFWLPRPACGLLAPWPGIEPIPSAVKVQGPKPWTTRDFARR